VFTTAAGTSPVYPGAIRTRRGENGVFQHELEHEDGLLLDARTSDMRAVILRIGRPKQGPKSFENLDNQDYEVEQR
jgi:hypothetical protein